MALNYQPLLNSAAGIGDAFLQGQQQGRELRMQGQRDNALRALSTNPQDIGAINALMAVDPRTALAYRQDARAQAQEARADQRNAAFGQALSGMEGLPEPVRQLAQADPEGAMQLWQVVQTADAAKLKQIDEMRQRTGALVLALQDVPEAQRAQAAAQLAPQYGVTNLQGLDFSNAGIQRSLNEAVGIGEMLKIRIGQQNADRNYGLQVAEFQANQQYRGAQLGLEAARLRASQAPQPMSVGDQIKLAEFTREQADRLEKAQLQVTGARQKTTNVLAAVREASALARGGLRDGGFIPNAGFGSEFFRARGLEGPNTLAGALETVLGNLSFQELQAMRAASPTGGALGAISDRELSLLGSTVASLRQNQDPAQLRANLGKVAGHFARWQTSVEGLDPNTQAGRARAREILRENGFGGSRGSQVTNSPLRPGARQPGPVDFNSLPE